MKKGSSPKKKVKKDSSNSKSPNKKSQMDVTFKEAPENGINIGNYIIGKELGKGHYGKIKLGFQKVTNEKVAIKIIEKSKIKD